MNSIVNQQLEIVKEGEQEYVLVNLDSMQLDEPILFDLYFRTSPGQALVLYCEKGVSYTRHLRHRLRINDIQDVFVPQKQFGLYQNYINNHLDAILKDNNLPIQKKASIIYDASLSLVEDIYTEEPSSEDIRRSKQVNHHSVNLITSDSFLFEHLLRSISCEYYLFTHSVNVCAYSIALSYKIGLHDKALLREIANGALLHDIGKSDIPHEILQKENPLSPDEWKAMREHPIKGMDLLTELNCLGEVALDVVKNHHERIDGSGYPVGLEEEDVSAFSRIVAIADTFDALTTDRFHQQGRSSFEALKLMKDDLKGQLDPEYMHHFIEMMRGD